MGKKAQDELRDWVHCSWTKVTHSEKSAHVYRLGHTAKDLQGSVNCGNSAIALGLVYKLTGQIALSVVCNDGKLGFKTSVSL